MFGRLVHYGVDAVLVSAVFAGVKQSTGYGCVTSPKTHTHTTFLPFNLTFLPSSLSPEKIGLPEGSVNTFARQYLSIGEYAFKWACATSLTSGFFDQHAGQEPLRKP